MATRTRLSEPVENRLLAALPRDEYDRLLPQLQQVTTIRSADLRHRNAGDERL